MDYEQLPARADPRTVHVVVESPRGSGVKLKWSADLGAFTLSRPLLDGLHFPFDWGFIPSTHAPDEDPLDAVVLHDHESWPGVVWPCRVLGVAMVTQKKRGSGRRIHNDRLICVPVRAPRYDNVRDVKGLSRRVREELTQFFLTAVVLEGKDARVEGWEGPRRALQLLSQAEEAFTRR